MMATLFGTVVVFLWIWRLGSLTARVLLATHQSLFRLGPARHDSHWREDCSKDRVGLHRQAQILSVQGTCPRPGRRARGRRGLLALEMSQFVRCFQVNVSHPADSWPPCEGVFGEHGGGSFVMGVLLSQSEVPPLGFLTV